MRKARLFITFEGGEGSGKTTQIKRLAKKLEHLRYGIVVTREPGGTDIGEQIRRITHDPSNKELTGTTEAYLMAAARAQHMSEVIRPALKDKKIVLCDRFLDSSVVYQGIGRELGVEEVLALNKLAIGDIVPDITIYLDITPNQGKTRKGKMRKKPDRLDEQPNEFYVRVYRGYRKLIQGDPKRFVVLDAEADPDTLEEKIWEEVEKKLS